MTDNTNTEEYRENNFPLEIPDYNICRSNEIHRKIWSLICECAVRPSYEICLSSALLFVGLEAGDIEMIEINEVKLKCITCLAIRSPFLCEERKAFSRNDFTNLPVFHYGEISFRGLIISESR
jgi:hypothetical protein